MLRYSSTFIPHPIDMHRYPSAPDCLKHTPSAEVIVQFESSAKWPDDLSAIQKVKLALLEKLARIVNAQMKGARAEIVFDGEKSEIEDHAGLEILLPAGVAFTLRIHHEKERVHLERILTEDAPVFGTSLPRPSRRLAQPALESYMRRFVHRPTHHAALAPMHHRYPSYSSATRLLKRWFAAHMLSLQVRSEAIELLMAAVYLDPLALSTPSSATVGFVRAIERLATWDWMAEPIFVPVFTASREAATRSERTRLRFPSEAREEATRLFGQMRAKDPEVKHGAWGIVTEEDVDGWRWTQEGPSRVVAGRVTGLARATAEAIRQANEGAGLNVRVS
jgi:U3 small nucleolar RNA-associated protein 22